MSMCLLVRSWIWGRVVMLKDETFFKDFLRTGSLLLGESGVQWAFVPFFQ